MSLVSLTFGREKTEVIEKTVSLSDREVVSPQDLITVNSQTENTLEIKKACQFLGHEDVYVVAQIMTGALTSNMKGFVGGKPFELVELESKYGNRIAKTGMTVGLTVRGLPKEVFERGKTISFRL